MRINEYNNLEEFRREFSGLHNQKYETSWAVDFVYNGKNYTMTMEQRASDKFLEHASKVLGKKLGNYSVCLVDKSLPKDELSDDEFHYIGWYDDIDDVLENCYIEGRKFKDVIMDDNTLIEGKD